MDDFEIHSHKIEKYLKKNKNEFTREDIIKYIVDNKVEMVNFRYVAEDGKLKMLSFIINSLEHLESIFESGERVDGSSLFSFIEAGSSDLYAIPRFKSAFVNPFAEIPTIDFLCSFYNAEGKPLESAPEYILKKAHEKFKKHTGLNFKALGELEFYVIGPKKNQFPSDDQKGYHSSSPFIKWTDFRIHAMKLIAECGGKIKYGHSEVGNFSTETQTFEQHEIEFLPVDVEDAAEQLIISKWILRMLAFKYGIEVSFSPKITVGKAGSGMHIHVLAEKNGKNILIENNKLSNEAKKIIAGILDLAPAITAFGNSVPTSYLRLVPHQEAPTRICWGDRNRSVLMRVPLGWIGASNMVNDLNNTETKIEKDFTSKQTVELRSPDGSADVYLLLAGIVMAALHGFEMPNAIELAKKLYVDVNIFKEDAKEKTNALEHLPASCWQSAEKLNEKRCFFEKYDVFPSGTIDNLIKYLKSFDDLGLSEKLYGNNAEMQNLVQKYFHWK
ncbi:MAG: glutamine synthetase [Bacteroidetes bacterium CG_4_10_14_3_um_filter_31_20]|nr:MAG: glutamine synthetase [Bacteroidetes bacterium CG_4_10_14_3_um_filter_31_20]